MGRPGAYAFWRTHRRTLAESRKKIAAPDELDMVRIRRNIWNANGRADLLTGEKLYIFILLYPGAEMAMFVRPPAGASVAGA